LVAGRAAAAAAAAAAAWSPPASTRCPCDPALPAPGPCGGDWSRRGASEFWSPCRPGLPTQAGAARLSAALPPLACGGRHFVYQMCAITDLLRVGASRGATHAPTRGCLRAEPRGPAAGGDCILGSAGAGAARARATMLPGCLRVVPCGRPTGRGRAPHLPRQRPASFDWLRQARVARWRAVGAWRAHTRGAGRSDAESRKEAWPEPQVAARCSEHVLRGTTAV
jgi:hypothetical protein